MNIMIAGKNVKSKKQKISTFSDYMVQYDDNILKRMLSKTKITTSNYEQDLKKKSEFAEHKRKEERKDLQHILISSFSRFFSFGIKIVIILYLIGLTLNIFFGYNFVLSKLEIIVYTFLTVALGVLIDRTMFKKENE